MIDFKIFNTTLNISGIQDDEMRASFLDNSKTDNMQIKRKCLENVDPETQKHVSNFYVVKIKINFND